MTEKHGPRDEGALHDGIEDGLEPLAPLDLSKIDSFDDLLEAYKRCSFGARSLGEAADVFAAMIADEDCFVVLTLSGAMTVAKMGLVICDMIEQGMVGAVVSTGALMAHGLVEAEGLLHFKARPGANDRDLYYEGYDRIYDTYELEKNLDEIENTVFRVLATVPEDETLCSRTLNRAIGESLTQTCPDGRGVLPSAYRKDVPVYVPAFTDSELGLNVGLHNRRRAQEGRPPLAFDPFLDLEHFTETLIRQKSLGIFTIGGGVPRNWAQQFSPYVEIINKRLGGDLPRQLRYRYGVRICPEPAHWGGLSGCTYSEGVSWGKFVPPSEGGRWAEVRADATLVWPILVKAVQQRLGLGDRG